MQRNKESPQAVLVCLRPPGKPHADRRGAAQKRSLPVSGRPDLGRQLLLQPRRSGDIGSALRCALAPVPAPVYRFPLSFGPPLPSGASDCSPALVHPPAFWLTRTLRWLTNLIQFVVKTNMRQLNCARLEWPSPGHSSEMAIPQPLEAPETATTGSDNPSPDEPSSRCLNRPKNPIELAKSAIVWNWICRGFLVEGRGDDTLAYARLSRPNIVMVLAKE